MRKLGLNKQVEDESDIDLTPMLDVIFIMLIFFIVTASFVKEIGLDMNAPPEQNDQPPPPDSEDNTILIRIEANGQIWIENSPTDIDGVEPNVKRIHAQNPKSTVIIQPDPKTKTDVMIRVLDQARAAEVPASIAALE